jgi:hypothetical protein
MGRGRGGLADFLELNVSGTVLQNLYGVRVPKVAPRVCTTPDLASGGDEANLPDTV